MIKPMAREVVPWEAWTHDLILKISAIARGRFKRAVWERGSKRDAICVAQGFLAARRKKSSDALSCHFIASCVRFMHVIFFTSLGNRSVKSSITSDKVGKIKRRTSLLIQEGRRGSCKRVES